MKKVILIFAIFFTTSIVFTSCKSEKKEEKIVEIEIVDAEEHETKMYQCPMKCEKEKKYKEEGKCPVCEMKLKKISEEEDEEHEEEELHEEEEHEGDND